jgi:hypothetical protein
MMRRSITRPGSRPITQAEDADHPTARDLRPITQAELEVIEGGMMNVIPGVGDYFVMIAR